jgi:predicted transposase YbfD/YdcC
MEDLTDRLSLKTLLEHFSDIEDARDNWRVAYPLPEVLFLVVSGTLAACDDFDDIALWGEEHIDFLHNFLPYHHGVPCARWLNILMNRIDPDLFSACFMSWAVSLMPGAADIIALDGKTSRRSHDKSAGKAALHMVSAFATHASLVLGQEAVADKSNEITAIPALLEKLAKTGGVKGAIVTVDAMGCNPRVTESVIGHGADYLIALKRNQAALFEDVERLFADPEAALHMETAVTHDKGHGRIEKRTALVSTDISWMSRNKPCPGEYRFPSLRCLVCIRSKVEEKGTVRTETRYYISSRQLSAEDALKSVRAHWSIENCLHWVMDVTFRDDLSRVRKGHGAENMAVVRHFAFNLIRRAKDKYSLKRRRKLAGWSPDYLASLFVNPDS